MTTHTSTLPFLRHLYDLRTVVLKVIVILLITTASLTPFVNDLFAYATKPLLSALPVDTKLLAVGVVAPVFGPLKVLLFCAFCISLPATLWVIWSYIAPALYKNEKKKALPFVFSTLLMFGIGVLYCYFVVFGFLFKFIASFSPEAISFAPDIDSYISFVLHMFLSFGLAFELPIAVVILHNTGIATLSSIKKFRRYIIVIAFVIAAVITPPDIASQLFLAIPLILLYELGIILCSLFKTKVKVQDAVVN